MNRSTLGFVCALGAVVFTASDAAAQTARVSTVANRDALLQRAESFAASLGTGPAKTDSNAKDPFNPPESDLRETMPVVDRPVEAGPRQLSPREVLALAADRMNVIGTAARGDETFLMLREKMLKTGDVHVVRHEGVDYAVTITHIEGNRYTLRYRNEELTRAIQ